MKYDFPIIFKFLNSLQDMLNVFEVLLFPSTFCTAVREGMSFFPISMNFFISRCLCSLVLKHPCLHIHM